MLHSQTISNPGKRFSLKSQRHWVVASMATATLFTSVSTLFPDRAVAAEITYSSVETVSRQVHVGDLDLARSKDRVRLKRRVTIAAREMCEAGGLAGIVNARKERRCIADAVSQALSQIDSNVRIASVNR